MNAKYLTLILLPLFSALQASQSHNDLGYRSGGKIVVHDPKTNTTKTYESAVRNHDGRSILTQGRLISEESDKKPAIIDHGGECRIVNWKRIEPTKCTCSCSIQ